MTIVGIDLSLTCTGLARIHPDGRAYTWHEASIGKRGDTLAQRADRLADLASRIVIGVLSPSAYAATDLAVIEAPSHGQPGGSTWDRAGLWWDIVGRLHRHGTPTITISPTTRAKWASGTGKGDKAAVALGMARLFPTVEMANSDEADALCLAHIGAVLAGYDVPVLARHTVAELPASVDAGLLSAS